MAEYIEREAVFNWFCESADINGCVDLPKNNGSCKKGCRHCTSGKELDEIPDADVRPVVTCGKCKYGKYTGTEWFCDKHSGHADKFGEDASYHEYHSKHWYCADGEARNNES